LKTFHQLGTGEGYSGHNELSIMRFSRRDHYYIESPYPTLLLCPEWLSSKLKGLTNQPYLLQILADGLHSQYFVVVGTNSEH